LVLTGALQPAPRQAVNFTLTDISGIICKKVQKRNQVSLQPALFDPNAAIKVNYTGNI
jgi:hypothetical protein